MQFSWLRPYKKNIFIVPLVCSALLVGTGYVWWHFHHARVEDKSLPRSLGSFTSSRPCLSLGTAAANLTDITVRLFNPSGGAGVASFDALTSDTSGNIVLDAYDTQTLAALGLSIFSAEVSAPGYLNARVDGVMYDGSACPDVSASFRLGDFDESNAILLPDLATSIRAHNIASPEDSAAQLAQKRFGGQKLSLSDIVTVIRNLNEHPAGSSVTAVPGSSLVTSFETAGEISAVTLNNSTKSASTTGTTEGSQSLAITLASGNPYAGMNYVLPGGAQNWSAYSGMAVDLTNPTSNNISVNIRASDPLSTDGYTHAVQGAAGLAPNSTGTYYLGFADSDPAVKWGVDAPPAPAGMSSVRVSTGGSFNAANVTYMTVSIADLTSPMTLYIDNIRLVRAPSFSQLVDKYGQYSKRSWSGKVMQDSDISAQVTTEQADIAAHPTLSNRDVYGGWTGGPAQTATGYFYPLKVNSKWWLVDPLGNLFFSQGINTVNAASNKTVIQGREFLFQDLPTSNDPSFGQFFSSATPFKGPVTGNVNSYSFYQANLFRKFGSGYAASWNQQVADRMKSWGFNTLGGFSDYPSLESKNVPYIVTLTYSGTYKTITTGYQLWGAIPDVYDSSFLTAVNTRINSQINNFRITNPYLIGYTFDNEMSWGNSSTTQYNVPIGVLGMDAATSPAKQAFVTQLQTKYSTIGALNTAWSTSFASWAALSSPYTAPTTRPAAMITDCSNYLTAFANLYYSTIRNALDAKDPNHLYLGSRFGGDAPPEVVQAAADNTDVISVNKYSPLASWWTSFNAYDRPVMITEYHYSATDQGLLAYGLGVAADQTQRAVQYSQFVNNALDGPVFVGAHWFEYFDQPVSGRFYDGESFNTGLVDVTDKPYPDMVQAARIVNGAMYTRRYGP